jgi:hypothetical protein
MLVIVLNDQKTADKTTIETNPSLWVPAGKYSVSRYNSVGRLMDRQTVSLKKGRHLTLKTQKLKPLEMTFYEFEPK